MAEAKTRFFCTSCGSETLKWEGRCPACGEWNTLRKAPGSSGGGDGGGRSSASGPGAPPRPLREAHDAEEARIPVELGEVDRVLGGGIVPGSLVLLGGAPGVGKSTLLLQVAARLLSEGSDVLYVSGEESARQVRLRAGRIGDGADDVPFLAETDVERVIRQAEELGAELLCVDSIQTLRSSRVDSAPGNVAQVRECAAHLQTFAKERDTATFLVGHVTKGGGLAGPRTLEHLVDTVLMFDGERTLEHRLLRAVKNRFGGVDELGVFRMTSSGLDPVGHPSEIFLPDRPEETSGSAVAVTLHGSRPLLAEVQALTAPSRYGSPQRVATGLPSRRLSLLLAVLERRAGIALGEADVFVNVVGGLRLDDTAADLAVLAALVSAETDAPLPGDLAFTGEVGLGGEIRGVAQSDRRVKEAARSGMRAVALPAGSAEGLETSLELRPLSSVRDLTRLVEEA